MLDNSFLIIQYDNILVSKRMKTIKSITSPYHILKVIIFPQASPCSYPSSTVWTLGSTFLNALFHTSAAESVKAFGYDMWFGICVKTYGTPKAVVN
jgi:hypothetical protein